MGIGGYIRYFLYFTSPGLHQVKWWVSGEMHGLPLRSLQWGDDDVFVALFKRRLEKVRQTWCRVRWGWGEVQCLGGSCWYLDSLRVGPVVGFWWSLIVKGDPEGGAVGQGERYVGAAFNFNSNLALWNNLISLRLSGILGCPKKKYCFFGLTCYSTCELEGLLAPLVEECSQDGAEEHHERVAPRRHKPD